MEHHPVITLDNVSFSYDGPPVIRDASLTIECCDFVCIIGPNGGGKTTLVKLMLGLIEPQRGSVRILGKSPRAACKSIGYMPQHVNLDPQFPVSAMDVVLMGRLGQTHRFGPYTGRDRIVALKALADVGLEGIAHRGFSLLSGGQRQRVLIARALACEPELLILDEPTASLDPAVQESLYALLSELNKTYTIVIVSHDVGFVSSFFRTVVCVNRTVHTHSSSELTSHDVAEMYGREVRLVHPPKVESSGAQS